MNHKYRGKNWLPMLLYVCIAIFQQKKKENFWNNVESMEQVIRSIINLISCTWNTIIISYLQLGPPVFITLIRGLLKYFHVGPFTKDVPHVGGGGVCKKRTWGDVGGGGGHEKGTSPLYVEKYTIFSVKKET